MASVPATVAAVEKIVASRKQWAAAKARIWSLDGPPLIGIVSASDAERWHFITRHLAFLDEAIASIHQNTEPPA